MKYFFSGLVLFICVLAYIRSEQPKIWNGCLIAVLKESKNTSNSAAAPSVTAPSVTAPSVTAPSVTAPSVTAPSVTAPTNSEVQTSPNEHTADTPTGIVRITPVVAATNVIATNVIVNSPKVFVPPDPLPAQPNWTWTVQYKDYHNVVVTKVEADSVHITYDGGIGSIKQADLPPELQKMFNYDPELAAQANQQKAQTLAQAQAGQRDEIASNKINDYLNNNSYTAHILVGEIGTAGGLVVMSITTQKETTVAVPDNTGMIPMSHNETRTVTDEKALPHKVWVIGLPSSILDGDTWDGVVYLIGTYNYNGLIVQMFAASKPAAYAYVKEHIH